MQELFARIRDQWNNTTRTNQVVLVAIMAAAVMVGVGLLYWAGTPDYKRLVSSPSAANAGQITGMLDERKVAYRITPDGSIDVPSADAPKLRMALASKNLLESGTLGYELLEKNGMGTTQNMEMETIRRAHEGELAKSIKSFDQVDAAIVHLADGSQDPFVDPKKKEASASIMVHLRTGATLTKENIQAIVRLVQSGYGNLSPRNINVVDHTGRLLWDGAENDSGVAGTDERNSQERTRAAMIENDIEKLLTPFGKENFKVGVTARLDLDRTTQRKNEVTPGQKTSKTTREEIYKGAGSISSAKLPLQTGSASNTGTGGVPNAVTTYQGVSNDAKAGEYTTANLSETSVPSTSETTVVRSPGDLKEVHVSVLVDEKKVKPDQAAKVEKQISNLVGKSGAPAGMITVSVDSVPFDKTAEDKMQKEAASAMASERINQLIGYGVPFGLMFFMLLILSRSLKKVLPTTGQLAIAGAGTMALSGGKSVSGKMEPRVDIAVTDAMSEISTKTMVDVDGNIINLGDPKQHVYEVINEQFDAELASIVHLTKSKPEMVSRLMRGWLNEDHRSSK